MKKRIFLIIFLASINFISKAQSVTTKDSSKQNDTTPSAYTEKTAEFPGGIEALYRFISKNIKNPGCSGRVMVQFVVERDGSLTNIHVTKSLTPECDAEALRVINKSPKWAPAMQYGKPVRILFTVPITFSLE